MKDPPSSLQWGRCRFSGSSDSECRRRRRPRSPEKHRLPTGSLLIHHLEGVQRKPCWTLCRTLLTASPESFGKVTLHFDDSIRLVPQASDLESDRSSETERLLSILDPEGKKKLVPSHVVEETNTTEDCLSSSQRQLSVVPVEQDAPGMLDSGSVASFAETPAPLLSISVIQITRRKVPQSPLEQACLKRQLIGCHVIYVDGKLTTEMTFPFQERVFRVASVLPCSSQSRTVSRRLQTRRVSFQMMPAHPT